MEISDDVRRIVTGHDASGKAIVLMDGTNPHRVVRALTGTVNNLMWMAESTPAEMSGDIDRAAGKGGVAPPKGGSVFRIVDFPPTTDEEIAKFDPQFLSKQIPHEGHHSSKDRESSHPFMHRTCSLDYAVVIVGEIDMKLDDSEIHLKAGDVLIQQGTNHAWINRSGKTCRVAFILIDAVDPFPNE
jgi:mannose-6-phosphate isomerase-like protein (cupin superfamily)